MPVSAVEAELADRLAEQLRNALGVIETLTLRRGDYLAKGVQASAAIAAVLDEYKAVQARLAIDKTATVRVILGESPEVGSFPKTFIFDTSAECAAFVRGLNEIRDSGSLDFNVCQNDRETKMADGEIRAVPEGVNPEGPVVICYLTTADECKKQVVFGTRDDASLVDLVEIASGQWEPAEPAPEAQTVSVAIEVHDSKYQEDHDLTGDQWRALEDSGELEEYLYRLSINDLERAEEILDDLEGERASP